MDTHHGDTLYASFLDESLEYIKTLNSDLIRMEKNPDDEVSTEHAFRTAHSLKSEASYLREKEIADTAHTIENLLDEARRHGEGGTSTYEALFSTVDKLSEMIDLRRQQRNEKIAERREAQHAQDSAVYESTFSGEENEAGAPSLLRRAETRRRESEELRLPEFTDFEKRLLAEARDRGEELFRVAIDLSDETSMAFAKAYLLLNNLEQLVQVVRSEPPLGGTSETSAEEQSTAAAQEPGTEQYRKLTFFCTGSIDRGEMYRAINIDQVAGIRISPLGYTTVLGESPEQPEKSSDSYVPSVAVRVEGDDIEEMNGYIDELKIRTHRLRRYYDTEGGQTEESRGIPYEQIEVLTELADGLERLAKKVRTVSLKEVLEPHHRLVRDLSKEMDKRVELSIEGEDVTVDRRAAEILSELTVHLLRNAVVHGIESPEERSQNGKAPVGTVHIHVDGTDEYLYVQVVDDGRGIDEAALRERAREQGISPSQTEENPLLAYLVYPGVTTSAEANEYSGRGYGLDLVYKKLRQMEEARLDVENDPGRGATFTLVLPAGFALTALQMVRYGDDLIAVPKKHIERHFTPELEEYGRGEKGELMWNNIPVYSPEGRLYHTGTVPPQRQALQLTYLGKQGLVLVDEVLFEKEIPEERLILYLEGSPYLHRMAISGNETNFSYLSPSILAMR